MTTAEHVTLREPAKDEVLRHQPGEAFEREARRGITALDLPPAEHCHHES